MHRCCYTRLESQELYKSHAARRIHSSCDQALRQYVSGTCTGLGVEVAV